MADVEGRVNRIVEAVLRGGRWRIGVRDREEAGAIMMAARLAGARQAAPGMSPELRRRLAASLQPAPSGRISRRGLLGGGAALAAALAGGAGLGRWLGPSPVPPAPLRAAAPGAWIPVAVLSELPPGRPVKALAGDVLIFLTRTSNQVAATSALCSDLPCALAAQTDDGRPVLYCPCHRASFGVDGAQLDGPEYGRRWPDLTLYAVRVVDGEVLVRVR